MFDIEEAGAGKAPLRARLIAEADVVAIAPPPTLAVRAAGTRRTRRRRALQAGSGAVLACAVAGAVAAWSPGRSSAAPGGVVATPHVTTPSPDTGTDTVTPGFLTTEDLGPGWVGPFAIPEQNIRPALSTLLECAVRKGQKALTQPIQPPVFRGFNRTDYSAALEEAVYEFPGGEAADVMQVLRAATLQGCQNPGSIVSDSVSAGDESIVFERGSNPAQPGSWSIFIRSGDRIAFVSTSASSSPRPTNAWRDDIESKVAARLAGS